MIERSDLYACTFLACQQVHIVAGSAWSWVWAALFIAVKWHWFRAAWQELRQ